MRSCGMRSTARVIGEFVRGSPARSDAALRTVPRSDGLDLPDSGPVAAVLAPVYQSSVVAHVLSGAEILSLFDRGERRTIVGVILGGIPGPVPVGLLLISIIDAGTLRGPTPLRSRSRSCSGSRSRSQHSRDLEDLFDLGVIGTSFSRIVLGAAVSEDVVLYGSRRRVDSRRATKLAVRPSRRPEPRSRRRGGTSPITCGERRHSSDHLTPRPEAASGERYPFGRTCSVGRTPCALQLALMFAVSALCVVLGIAPMLGAFVAGCIVGNGEERGWYPVAREHSSGSPSRFHLPCYFALVVPVGPAARLTTCLFFGRSCSSRPR